MQDPYIFVSLLLNSVAVPSHRSLGMLHPKEMNDRENLTRISHYNDNKILYFSKDCTS